MSAPDSPLSSKRLVGCEYLRKVNVLTRHALFEKKKIATQESAFHLFLSTHATRLFKVESVMLSVRKSISRPHNKVWALAMFCS
jgi:hypothetical protein